MANTQVIDASTGKVLIEQVDWLPSPGERMEIAGKQYAITTDQPVAKTINNGMGEKWMRVVKAKRVDAVMTKSPAQSRRSGRGPAVEG